MTREKEIVVILGALAEAFDAKNERIGKLKAHANYLDETNNNLHDVVSNKQAEINKLLAKVDDLAQQLAVTECQLEEARKRLKRYEGGGN